MDLTSAMNVYDAVFNQKTDDPLLYWDEDNCWYLSDLIVQIDWVMSQLSNESSVQSKVKSQLTQDRAKTPKRWAIITENRFYFTASLFAVLYMGDIPVLLGHNKTALLLEQQEHFDGLITTDVFELPATIPQWQLKTAPTLDHKETGDRAKLDSDLPVNFNVNKEMSKQAFLTLFTSGSTGTSVPLQKSIALLAAESELLKTHWGDMFKGKKLLSTVSPMHQYGLTFTILFPFILRMPVFNRALHYHEELHYFLEHDEDKGYLLISSPAFLKRLDPTLISDNSCCAVFSAGGPLSTNDAKAVATILGVYPREIYGSSETGVIATRQQIFEETPFKTFPSIIISQFDDQSINVQSPLMVKDDYFRLNDLIELYDKSTLVEDECEGKCKQKEGQRFFLRGRLDRIVKIEEKRISLSDVERRLQAIEGIKQAVVIPLQGGRRNILGAVIVLSHPIAEPKMKFYRYLRHKLLPYLDAIAIPRRWCIIDQLPYNAQGKLIYHDLKGLFNEKNP